MKKQKPSTRQQTLRDIVCEVREMARYAKALADVYRTLDRDTVSSANLKKLVKEKKERARVCLEVAKRIEAGELD